MKKSDFYYSLPEELIAQSPSGKRDLSRLLVYHRETKEVTHTQFCHVTDYLRPGDALVLNNTRVMPARLLGKREDTGGAMEFLLLKQTEKDVWEVMVKPGRRAKTGARFSFGENGELKAEVLASTAQGNRLVRFDYSGVFFEVLDRAGIVPLPPYITRKLEDASRYQTVYAKVEGSAAAPTAGLHFTEELLGKVREMGVKVVEVLLHVGPGTFRPVKEENVEDHAMHSEYYEITPDAARMLNAVRQSGGRMITVGTTSARVLETVTDEAGVVIAGTGETSIFIYPGYRFRAVDALITNFHLPESTLIMLVSALAGREETLALYKEAVEQRYRFFSFGDAMMIL
ncbi:MAG: tRNA preQ1(34) S-adenosylmethionine ribosyltransferase-isomerase QueA [Christensenellales bacterium]